MKASLKAALAASTMAFAIIASAPAAQAACPADGIITCLGLTVDEPGESSYNSSVATIGDFIDAMNLLKPLHTYAEFYAAFDGLNALDTVNYFAIHGDVTGPGAEPAWVSAVDFTNSTHIVFSWSAKGIGTGSATYEFDRVVPGPVAGAGLPFLIAGGALWMRRRATKAA